MKNDENTFATIIRLDLRTPEGWKAHKLLTQRDKKKYHSYGDLVASVVSAYYDRQTRLLEDPYLETREKENAFLEKVLDTIRESLQSSGAGLSGLAALLQHVPATSPPTEQAMTDEDLDIATDFINSL